MKRTMKLLALVMALVMMLALAGCGAKDGDGDTITITVTVVHKDGSENKIEIDTAEDTLGRALVEAGVVEDNQSTYGLYILTVDDETVDEANQEWWCITKGGESVMTGADETEILNGEEYELTFTTGY